jgi:hypothetical protein
VGVGLLDDASGTELHEAFGVAEQTAREDHDRGAVLAREVCGEGTDLEHLLMRARLEDGQHAAL